MLGCMTNHPSSPGHATYACDVDVASCEAGFDRLPNERGDHRIDLSQSADDSVDTVRNELLELAIDDSNRVPAIEIAVEKLAEE